MDLPRNRLGAASSLPLDLSIKSTEMNDEYLPTSQSFYQRTISLPALSSSENVYDEPLDLSMKNNEGMTTDRRQSSNSDVLFSLGLCQISDVATGSNQEGADFYNPLTVSAPGFEEQLAQPYHTEPNRDGMEGSSNMPDGYLCQWTAAGDTESYSGGACNLPSEDSQSKDTNKSKLYSCYMCGRGYKQARDYRAHLAAHTNGTMFKCDICPCVLSNSLDYLQHLKTHRHKDLHFCSHCNKYFRDACTLSTHIRTHTGEKPYQCDVCHKKFRQSGTYHRHMKLHDDAAS